VSRSRASERHSNPEATIGLIVEGDAEFKALPRLHKLLPGCPPLKAINLGGIGAECAPEGVARRVVPKVIAHQAAGRIRIILCIDRENRQRCAPGFASDVSQALTRELKQKGRPSTGVHVVIMDRAFEAWILADARGLHARRKFKSAPPFHCFEGELGAQQRLGVVEMERLLGRPYSKTSDGPELFSALRFPEARAHQNHGHGSRSLDKFLRTLGV